MGCYASASYIVAVCVYAVAQIMIGILHKWRSPSSASDFDSAP